MQCQRCGQPNGSVQVRLSQAEGEPVELLLCHLCLMVEAHKVPVVPGAQLDEDPLDELPVS